MGRISAGIPAPQVPMLSMSIIRSGMLVDAVILAVMCFAIAFSVGKIYAKKNAYTVSANQELLALGTANAFASFFSCFPATASLSRAAIMGEYARSQVSSLVSCVALVFVLLFAAPALSQLPKSVVAVIIIFAQKTLVMQVTDCKKAFKSSVWEGMVWSVTFVSVLLLGLDVGLLCGVFFSVIMVLKRTSSISLRRLGKTSSDEFTEVSITADASELPGVRILRLSSPLFFLNSEHFKELVVKECTWLQAVDDQVYVPIRFLILDLSGVTFTDSSGLSSLQEVNTSSCLLAPVFTAHSVFLLLLQAMQELVEKEVQVLVVGNQRLTQALPDPESCVGAKMLLHPSLQSALRATRESLTSSAEHT